LYAILYPKRQADFIKTFLLMYQQGGRLPVWELAANETDCMIGYHSVSVITDSWYKGIRDFDSNLALDAMVKSATWKHLGLPAYIDNNYLSIDDEPESVSKTLEYAYDDWCIGRFAYALNKNDTAQTFFKRSESWRNLFDAETGFMRPRKNGAWLSPFKPEEVNNHFTEANSWQYSFFVPHNIAGLAGAHGGKDVLVKKLQTLFTTSSKTSGREQADITGLIGQYAHGNEPSHHMAWLFTELGEPGLSQEYVAKILNELYNDSLKKDNPYRNRYIVGDFMVLDENLQNRGIEEKNPDLLELIDFKKYDNKLISLMDDAIESKPGQVVLFDYIKKNYPSDSLELVNFFLKVWQYKTPTINKKVAVINSKAFALGQKICLCEAQEDTLRLISQFATSAKSLMPSESKDESVKVISTS
jgi:hypothetical protein